MNNFKNEWAILHGDIEKYERFSLIIKLFSVLISGLCAAYYVAAWFSVVLIFVLWLQDGIWKTFQKRIEARILFIETALRTNEDENSEAFQFYSQWEDNRKGVIGLVKEYLSNSAKPTVAYPYVVLVLLQLVYHYFVI